MRKLELIVFVIAATVVLCFLVAWPFLWLWNYAVVAAVTVAQPIKYWVAFWLMLFLSLFMVGSRSSR